MCWCVLMFFVVCFDISTWYRWRFKMYDVFCISSCAVYCWCVGVDVLMCVDVCWCVLMCVDVCWCVHLTLMCFCFLFFVLTLLLFFVIQANFQRVLARKWVKDDSISWLDTGDVLRCMMCFVFQVVLCIADVLVLMCWCVDMCWCMLMSSPHVDVFLFFLFFVCFCVYFKLLLFCHSRQFSNRIGSKWVSEN